MDPRIFHILPLCMFALLPGCVSSSLTMKTEKAPPGVTQLVFRAEHMKVVEHHISVFVDHESYSESIHLLLDSESPSKAQKLTPGEYSISFYGNYGALVSFKFETFVTVIDGQIMTFTVDFARASKQHKVKRIVLLPLHLVPPLMLPVGIAVHLVLASGHGSPGLLIKWPIDLIRAVFTKKE